MIGVEKCAIFLLVIALTDVICTVHGRSIGPPVLLLVMSDASDDVVPLIGSEKVAPVIVPFSDALSVPIPDEKDRVEVINDMLDALKSVNENALELIHTYIGQMDDKPIVEEEETISARDLSSEIETDKKLPHNFKLPQLYLPQISFVPASPQAALSPIHAALAKYKAAINALVKKFKTVPQHFIKKFKKGAGLADEAQNDEEEKPNEEKPAEEKPAEEKPAEEKPAEEKPAEEKPVDDKLADETMAEKPADDKIEEKPADAQEPASEARRLDLSNAEILAESDTVLVGNTPEEIANKVKTILDATRKMNEQSFDLIQDYLNHIIDLSKKNQDLVIKDTEEEIVARASEVQEIKVPLVPGCEVGYALVDGVCKQVYTPPVVPTNPLVAPINVLVQFVANILEPIVPKNVAEDLATQVKIRAEAIVQQFESN